MAKMEGFEKLVIALKDRAKRQRPVHTNLVVGYAAPYATRIHEDLEMFHSNGQAKYLEQPLREMTNSIAQNIRFMVGQNVGLDKALEQEGYRLLKASQELVPVDTGFLKESGFVEIRKS